MNRSYLVVNLIFAGLIALVFVYSAVFSAERDDHPVPSFFEEITGQPSPSSGMSRAFSEIMRGDLDSARQFNPDSVAIFLFFLVQLVQRLGISVILGRISRLPQKFVEQKKHLLLADASFTVVLFLFCFRGQIMSMIRLVF
jgi:hypothetical protein